jgi:hypothetical protein
MPDQSNVTVVTTPPDLLQRMSRYPVQLDAVMKETAVAALLIIHESVPAYPKQMPDSSYVRTGQLGRSMGVGQGGGELGNPDIYLVKKMGSGEYEGEFGTNLGYAPQVIGEQSQKEFFKARGWWTTRTIATRATPKIVKLYAIASEKMTKWLDGKNA